MSSLEAVMKCDEERLKLEAEAERLAGQDAGGGETLKRIYERFDAMDANTAEKRAAEILNSLGFDKKMQAKKTRDFSGGWRMRIALARALFMNPTILLMDERFIITQVTMKHLKVGKEAKMHVMVMENLFYKRNTSRDFDLKGSAKTRYNPNVTETIKTLLDMNLLEALRTKPIFLGSKAKRSLKRAVWNDMSFLASIDVMD